jgi:hypothetical protein
MQNLSSNFLLLEVTHLFLLPSNVCDSLLCLASCHFGFTSDVLLLPPVVLYQKIVFLQQEWTY